MIDTKIQAAAKKIIKKVGKELFDGEWHKYPRRSKTAAEFLLQKGLNADDVYDVIGAIWQDAKEQYGD